MTPEQAQKLLAPFPPKEIGKLPRVTCQDCSDRQKRCTRHERKKCATCKSYISEQHVHIDYVGHAHVTHRLLEVDPEWDWEPMAVEEDGLPRFIRDDRARPVGLWIRLTVAGKTRLGYGSCPGNQADAEKVLIGDAIRNAAQRFGVAWELWAKTDLADPSRENATAAPTPRQDTPEAPASGVPAIRTEIIRVARLLGMSIRGSNDDFAEWSQGVKIADADEGALNAYLETLQQRLQQTEKGAS